MSPRGGFREGAGRPHGSVKLPDAKTFGVHLPGRLQRDLSDVLRPGESRSDAIREAIGLLVAARKTTP